MRDVEMDRARFEELAEAYGGAVARWPTEVRGAAQAFVAAEPLAAKTILARAESLDAALDAWRPMPLSHDLRERVVARAPRAIRGAEWLSWALGAGAGAGLAMACAAGLALGVFMSGATTVAANDEPVSAVMTGYDIPVQADPTGAAT
jgi:hypothetical protein